MSDEKRNEKPGIPPDLETQESLLQLNPYQPTTEQKIYVKPVNKKVQKIFILFLSNFSLKINKN